jgi:hypothetical protein
VGYSPNLSNQIYIVRAVLLSFLSQCIVALSINIQFEKLFWLNLGLSFAIFLIAKKEYPSLGGQHEARVTKLTQV